MAEVSTAPERGTSSRSETDEQSGAAAQAQETMGQAKEAAQEKAQEAKQQASGKVREQVDQRSTQAGEQVTSTASDLRSVGEELRKQGKDTPAKLADQAAERTEKLGSYLTESNADRILSDVEDFARKQPWAVVAGGLVLGFAASRFLKASSSERYSSRSSDSSPQLESDTTGSNGYSASTAPPVYAPPVGSPAPEPTTRVAATATDDGVQIPGTPPAGAL
jgi:hypothetical protein